MGEAVVALEADHHAERPRRDLRVQPTARVMRGRREVQLLAPQVRVGIDLDQRERDRSVDFAAQPPHPLQFLLRPDDVLARGSLGGQFEHRLAAGRHGPAETEQFVLGGEGAGTGSPSIARWPMRARRRKSERAGLDRLVTSRPIAAMSSGVAGSLRAPRSPIA